MEHLTDCWYMLGWADELAPGQMLTRTFAERPLVAFRDDQGAIVTMDDTCPHRFAPLSRGRVERGHIFCGYRPGGRSAGHGSHSDSA